MTKGNRQGTFKQIYRDKSNGCNEVNWFLSPSNEYSTCKQQSSSQNAIEIARYIFYHPARISLFTGRSELERLTELRLKGKFVVGS